jgi:O-antigen/teichoic acid export membrane protein
MSGTGVAVIMAAVGLFVGVSTERALLIFAPWVPFALVQDLCRSVLFRDSLGRIAARNDIIWLTVTAIVTIGAWQLGTDWAVVGAWGIGAAAASVAGVLRSGIRPSLPRPALKYWRRRLWPLGRWLLASGMAYNATAQANVFVVGGVLGTASLGGLRVVQTAFAPLTLLSPAVSLPVLPAMARRWSHGISAARRLALQTSSLLLAITASYAVIVSFIGDSLLTFVFGDTFSEYEYLILPIAVQQVVLAASVGFDLLLRAGSHGRTLFIVRLFTGMAGVGAVAVAATTGDLLAVAWSMVAVAGLSSALLIAVGLLIRSKTL